MENEEIIIEDFENLLKSNIQNFKFCKNEKELDLKKRMFLNTFNEFILKVERSMKK